jgi:DNA-binding LytR/AlgR family response regulator
MLLKANYKEHKGAMFNLTKEMVAYVSQDGDYHNVYLDGRPFSISFHGSSSVVMERFPNLLRAHRGYYINPEKIFSLEHKPDNTVTIVFTDGKTLSFSKSKQLHESFLKEVEKNGQE